MLQFGKARAVTETFRYLSDADAARAEALILGQLAGKTYPQVLRLAEHAALTVDPGLAERRREQAQRKDARVTLFREQQGTVVTRVEPVRLGIARVPERRITGVEGPARPKAAMLLIVTNDGLLLHHRDDKPGIAHPAEYAGWMGGTVIRAARVADASQIAVVHVRSWQGAYRGLLPQAYLDGLDPAQRVGRWERSLAEANDGRNGRRGHWSQTRAGPCLVSLGTLRPAMATWIQRGSVRSTAIYLLPSAWGKGLGRRLMGAALTRLAEAQFDRVTLWVLDSNVRARRFYEAGAGLPMGRGKSKKAEASP